MELYEGRLEDVDFGGAGFESSTRVGASSNEAPQAGQVAESTGRSFWQRGHRVIDGGF
jgi:hypothetical protein